MACYRTCECYAVAGSLEWQRPAPEQQKNTRAGATPRLRAALALLQEAASAPRPRALPRVRERACWQEGRGNGNNDGERTEEGGREGDGGPPMPRPAPQDLRTDASIL
ncbi:unnamed protein product [Prorocentrum cordatum]|uniref:Uncharacterized protein n=1 Tax=Prorocentrum cordatum TaxID=2364126 RepID=A0ABN9USF3_9DINO|nr:unnamed protein product [Polarella glacialis]